MYAQVLALAERIEGSAVGVAIAESRWLFPLIEGVHLIGLSIAVGLIALIDLRLVGVFLRRVPVEEVLRALRPWVFAGFAAIFVSGGLLFWSAAARMVASPVFVAKMLLVLLGGANALYFELFIGGRAVVRHNESRPTVAMRYAGFASLGIWTLVVILGRLIPYLPSWNGAPP